MFDLKKSVGALILALALANMAHADTATKNNRYDFARRELMRLEELCDVTPMINRNSFREAPVVTNAEIISWEEIFQFEARITELKDCKPKPTQLLTQEILTGVPILHVRLIADRFQQRGKTVYIAASVNDQCGPAQNFYTVILSTLDSNALYCLIGTTLN